MSHSLDSFLRPRSLALIGATERSVWTRAAYANIQALGYTGKVHMVNRRGGTVLGRPAATSASQIGERADTALLMVPSDVLLETFPDLKAAGIKNAVLLSSGYAEAGAQGKQRQAELVATARENEVRLLGPNCLGFVNFVEKAPVWTVPVRGPILPGKIALVSQSGALAGQMSFFAQWQGIGLTYMVSTGNEADIDIAQVIDFLVDDPQTRAIGVFIETIRNPAFFAAAATRALAVRKPIVVLKIGASEVTAKAAQAHTGSLVGDDRVFDAACQRYGMIRVQSLEQLVLTCELLARTGPLGKGGLGVISMSGGMCEIGADRSVIENVPLPALSEETVATLKAMMPDFGTPHNPLDTTGAVMLKPELFGAVIDAMAADSNFSALLAIADVPSDQYDNNPLSISMAEHVAAALNRAPVPGIVSSHLARPFTALTQTLVENSSISYLPCGIHAAVAAFGRAFHWSRGIERGLAPAAPHRPIDGVKPRSEREVLGYLSGKGVPVIPMRLAQSAAEAAEFAASLDAPAVLKIASPDIPHKTEVGGVALNLAGQEQVVSAYETMMAKVRQAKPQAHLDGIVVSPMRAGGVELFVGTMRDPQWGPSIAVGLGGIWVEALKDTSLRLLPVNEADVFEMLGELRGAKLLDGFRGAPAVDRLAVAKAVVSIGNAALCLGPELVSLEINPILVQGARVECLDALAVWDDVTAAER